MRAMVYRRYGPPEVLTLEDVPVPDPGGGEVLVRVFASSVNAADLDLLHGAAMVRPGGLFRPRHRILGSDIAGSVEAIGAGAGRFGIGDRVYGDLTEHGFGAFSEYVSVPESALARIPAGLGFERAAAVPSAGGVALKNLLFRGGIEPGARVLINGAGGGMGTFAVQFARSYGAEVTGVDRGSKAEVVAEAGADHFIDYLTEDFTTQGVLYDLIIDVAAHRPVRECTRTLAAGGSYLIVGGAARYILQAAAGAAALRKREGKFMGLVTEYPTAATIEAISAMIERQAVKPLIDRVYPLANLADAFRRLDSGEVGGKVVVTVAEE